MSTHIITVVTENVLLRRPKLRVNPFSWRVAICLDIAGVSNFFLSVPTFLFLEILRLLIFFSSLINQLENYFEVLISKHRHLVVEGCHCADNN